MGDARQQKCRPRLGVRYGLVTVKGLNRKNAHMSKKRKGAADALISQPSEKRQ